MNKREQLKMPWLGPDEPPHVSAIYDDHDLAIFTGPGLDQPDTPWLVTVTWEHSGAAWRPVEVSLRSQTDAPVTATVWRSVPVTRAIRWSSAVLRALGKLAARTGARPEIAEELAARIYNAEPSRDGRVGYGSDHWDRVIEAWEAVGQRHDRRRAVARYLRERWPDDPRYTTITSPTDTRVKGWLDRLAKEDRITRSADKKEGTK